MLVLFLFHVVSCMPLFLFPSITEICCLSFLISPHLNSLFTFTIDFRFHLTELKWLVQNKLHVNLLVAKRHANNWQPRQRVNQRRVYVEKPPLLTRAEHRSFDRRAASRSRIVSVRVRSLCVKFVVTKNQRNCWSASCHFNGLCVKSPRTSRPICVFNRLRSEHFRRLAKRT